MTDIVHRLSMLAAKDPRDRCADAMLEAAQEILGLRSELKRNDDNHQINWQIASVSRASTDDLMMSRMHCHAKNVSSIVLSKHGGRLLRMFLAWPGHRLENNRPGGDLVVGIHNHRYDLRLALIHGDVENVVYDDVGDRGHMMNSWEFSSGVVNGDPIAVLTGARRVREIERTRLSEDDSVHLAADTLHTIECRGVCAWAVHEGETRRTATTLYTESDTVDTDGLYVPFGSRDEVVSHVIEWARYTT